MQVVSTVPAVLLASASPRRSELLRQIGVAHEVRPVLVDESPLPGEAPAAYVLRLAERKAAELRRDLVSADPRPVLAADTTVALDGRLFGKPSSAPELHEMLGSLSGRTHQVHTAVAVLHAGGAAARLSTSDVSLRPLTRDEIDWYWSTGEPADKAGGYAVQGRAAVFIRHISGSYSGVMGLPLYETWELLAPVLGLTPGSGAP
jgi:septum formation protein